MSNLRRSASLIVGLVLTHAASASATVEPPAVSDARSASLGGTGVAYSNNAAAVFHNPAALSNTEQGVVTLSISPFLPQLGAPIAGSQQDSSRGFFPMFLGGGAYRLSEDWVVGLAVYPVFGFGGEYKDLTALGGENLSMSAAAFEASPALSYSITDAISIGVGYRATYMIQDAHQITQAVDANGDPVLVASDLSLSGLNLLGLQAGILARLAEGTHIGLTYRNKVTVDLDGDFKSGGMTMDASSEFAAPHTFKLGLAQELLERQLMLTVELKYALYANSSKTSTVTVEGLDAMESPLEWKNSLGAAVGAEYRLPKDGPALRLGYSATQSATSKDYPQPFLAPPGLIHSVHAGAGMQFSDLEVSLGAFYMWSRAEVTPAADAQVEPGEYSINAYVAALSASYRF